MGKIGKKSKSERLNALRKQYDSFLDEDKKRKERNEFILGRLEKMRLYTPAVVPVRYNMGNPQISKYNFLTQERPEYHRKIRFDDTPILPSRQISVPAVCVTKDEETILQEISKKYILIPKLRFTSENNVMIHNPSSANNDADWRKKYNILDELKKIEKEGSSEISMDQPDKPYDNFKNDHEFNIAASNNIREQQKQNINRDPVLHTSQNDEHVSKLKTNKTKTARIDDLNYNVDCKPLLENKQTKISNIAASSDYENEVVCEPDLDINIEQNHITDSNELSKELYPHENVIKAEQKNENINKDKLPYSQVQNIQENEFKISDNLVPKKKDIENIKSEFDTENDTPDLENSKIHDSNFAVELNEKGNTEHNLNKDEIVVPPVETVKNQEPYLVVSPKEHDTENIQQQQYEPKGETSNISDNNIPSQIDDFEAEQKEMFYSEETNYNQNVDRAGNNTQNEEYTNEQYSYYNESQQDQPYYSEINEHEESTERYDPNYQPQYVGNYEENVNDAHYDNQQYEGDIFENQQDVTNVNYEQRPDQQEVLNVNYEQRPDQQEVLNLNYEQRPDQQEVLNVNYEQRPDQQEVLNVNYEQRSDQQEVLNVNYEQQPDQQEELNVNYEQQPDQQGLNVNYEPQPDQQEISNVNYEETPVNYEYENTGHFDDSNPSHVEDKSVYDGQASQQVNYENQIYDEVGEVEHPRNPDQNLYESQQNYEEQNTEQEQIQNFDQQLDGEGFTATKNTIPDKPATELENMNQILK